MNEHPQCVGCGYCCMQAMCVQGAVVCGDFQRRCPFLVWSDDAQRYWCQLVLEGRSKELDLYVGVGCSSSLNSWRKEVKNRDD